ncbi:hypothetical protein KEM56_000286 [Ascosphaera pollenicola]|nr:hypothetical protein KEM56_000286 [Ascosphaera pollenicola]
MKFAHDYAQALRSEQYPAQWLEAAIQYKQLKKAIKKVENELTSWGLHPDLLNLHWHPAVSSSLEEDDMIAGFHYTLREIEEPSRSLSPRFFLVVDRPAEDDAATYALADHGELSSSCFTFEAKGIKVAAPCAPHTAGDLQRFRGRHVIEIPLSYDAEFFGMVRHKLRALEELQLQQENEMNRNIQQLALQVSNAIQKPAPKSSALMYAWREIFRMYLEFQIFFSTEENRGGQRDAASACQRFASFEEVLKKSHLSRKLNKSGRHTLDLFLSFNRALLRSIKFLEINTTALRKILKKFDKHTALHAQPVFLNLVRPDIPAPENTAKTVCCAISKDLIGLVPQIDDYLCPICFAIAIKPRTQQNHCALCRDESVLDATGKNFDRELELFLFRYFPKEAKAKLRDNQKASNSDVYGELDSKDTPHHITGFGGVRAAEEVRAVISAVSIGQTCRKLYALSNTALLWRHHCLADFQYWDARHHLSEKLRLPAASTPWKALYADHHIADVAVSRLLDDMIAGGQAGRVQKYHNIVSFGYDAKDTLLRHALSNPFVHDNLARRYFSKSVLDFIHRSIAISTWASLRQDVKLPIEKALGAFDMFMSHIGKHDLDWMSSQLDDLATAIRLASLRFHELNPRQKAVCIADYLINHHLTGISDDADYHSLNHNFLGLALIDSAHNSLPLISAALYCAVARRLDLDAHPCGFPFHVHVIIKPQPGFDMNGSLLTGDRVGEFMYMDPFRSSEEVPISVLRDQLQYLGALTSSAAAFLSPYGTPETVLRCGKNILNSVSRLAHVRDAQVRENDLEVSNARHAALWSTVLLAKFDPVYELHGRVSEVNMIKRYLPALVESIDSSFAPDVVLVERYIVPLFHGTPEYDTLVQGFRAMRDTDEFPRRVRRRVAKPYHVRYLIGQVFTHRRYGYRGIIIGWDPHCEAEEQWMQDAGIDRLQSGRNQSFYHVMVEDKTLRYVAEENIRPIQPPWSELPQSFIERAGLYFKRWDTESRSFISNLQDIYPDD